MPPAILSLLADPHRWELLTALSQTDRRVGELTELVGAPQNLVSYHLRELRDAGLVTARRSSADGRDVYYRADVARCRSLLAAALDPVAPAPLAGRRGRGPRVLFVCTGNSARSQMAEALLVHRSDGAIEARSAGSHPKPLHPAAARVLGRRGIDISGNVSKHIDTVARLRFDRVITLCDKVREVCPDFPGSGDPVHWSMPDPSAEPDAFGDAPFERTADELEERIALLVPDLASRP